MLERTDSGGPARSGDRKPYGLLELGTNSLKVYLLKVTPEGREKIETRKVAWRVGHELSVS